MSFAPADLEYIRVDQLDWLTKRHKGGAGLSKEKLLTDHPLNFDAFGPTVRERQKIALKCQVLLDKLREQAKGKDTP